FEGWEMTLDSDNLSLLSILKFRKLKDDFTYNKHAKHFFISKEELGYVSKQPPKLPGYASGWEWVMYPFAVCEKIKLKYYSFTDPKLQKNGKDVQMFWERIEIEQAEIKAKRSLKRACSEFKNFRNSIFCGQIIGIDLLEDGLYFGLEGPTFNFPAQLTDIKCLRSALEALYFYKQSIVTKASLIPDPKKINNPYNKILHCKSNTLTEAKHFKLKFVRTTYFTPKQKRKYHAQDEFLKNGC
ncbi:11830_t:CDS:2, partial [Racocetra persica]